ncbi:MAG: phosphate ABC transporter permease PstA [Bacillota bacterium]|jgi:phosphate transport system permease protein|nr:phosphate ABC transporter permease PstA [Bacillota bacterium]NLP25197.1 phosphate ABC transporter permease PstA [Syntrophomonadaceae bacterium]NMB02559.1 phosphate ABC transporter permease PstA [Bacillota bacterium]
MGLADVKEKALTGLFWLSALMIVGVLVLIIGYIIVNGISAIDLKFILEPPSRAGKEGGISTTIVGTLYLTVVSLLLSVPVGVASAVYLEEYANPNSRFAYLVNLTAETMAGIPSIIFGLFGFVFFVIFLNMGWSVISGSLTLAIMILPTIMRTSQEAIKAVAPELRENSLALGASKWQTVQRIVLPSAVPGITTGIILSIGRAIGETAALILTAGSSLGMPINLSDPARSMAVHLYVLAMEGISMERAFGTACLLIVLIVILNFLANWSMRRLSRAAG